VAFEKATQRGPTLDPVSGGIRHDHVLQFFFPQTSFVSPSGFCNHKRPWIFIRRGESCIRPDQGDHEDRPYGTLAGTIGRVMQGFKSITTRKYIIGIRDNGWSPFPKRLWQRNYYERVVRDDSEMHCVREYITGNPAGWLEDEENPVHHI
jgi:hypothetical protein